MNKVDELHQKVKELRDYAGDITKQVTDAEGSALVRTTHDILAGLEDAFDEYKYKGKHIMQ